MKKLSILIIILFNGLRSEAVAINRDSSAQRSFALSTNLDTLQQQLKLITNDSLKSGICTQIAAQYLKYDSITNKKAKFNYQNQALNYTYDALHLYSRYHDTLGLRTSFDNLARVYRSQKKYPQAKWFILQSNTLSRAINDIPNIMASLITLANIKMEIKDYSLAMRDLNEALQLSKANHYPRVESHVQESYVLLYTRLKNYAKANIALKRHYFIEDSVLKNDEKTIAKTRDSLHAKRDSLQVKKKVYQVSRKSSKTNYSKKIAST